MLEGIRTVQLDGGSVDVRYKHTNRQREQYRRIYGIIADTGATHNTCIEFASVVAYTARVDGDVWQPPPSTASKEELLAAYHEWLDLDAGPFDVWANAAYIPPDPVTGPTPPAEDADPNSSSGDATGKKAS